MFDRGEPALLVGDDQRLDAGDAQEHAEDSAQPREQGGLDEELGDDVQAGGAQGAADADFAGAFGDGGEHDVHDADAAD